MDKSSRLVVAAGWNVHAAIRRDPISISGVNYLSWGNISAPAVPDADQMSTHHPTEEYLVHYAAGVLPEAQAVLVAAHLTFCPACRATVRDAEALGGLFAEATPSEVAGERVPDLETDISGMLPAPAQALLTGADTPAPLHPFIGARLADIPWRTFWPGMQTARIATGDTSLDLRLLRLKPGLGMPVHTHGGDELTLVLQGSYTDETGQYRRGDVAMADDSLTHYPVADAGEPCICLTVIEAPLKFRSPLARLAAHLLFR